MLVVAALIAVVAPVTAVAASCDSSTSTGVQLSVFWWGGQTRAELTQRALALYTQKHPNVTFKQQWQGNSGYFDKLATLAAAGGAPDLFQIDDNWITEYTSRGVTLDLKPYIGSRILTASFSKGLSNAGVIGGKVGGIAAAENTPAMIYDKTAVAAYGLAEPTVGMSWDSLVEWGAKLKKLSGGKVAGTMDPSADYKALQVWLRQHGKDLYNGAQLGFAQTDLTGWLQFWADARTQGATPSADVIHTANAGDVTKQLVATKKAATSFMWSNQLEELSKSTDHKLGLVSYPGDPAGQWARASMYWAGYRQTAHPEIVADVINFLVNDLDAAKILGAERGLAPNLKVRAEYTGSLSAVMQTSVKFETGLATRFGPTPAPPPKGHGQLKSQLVQAAESVQFGRATAEQAALRFFGQVESAIGG